MTTVINQCKKNKYYVYMQIETRWYSEVYVVGVCPCYNECLCGYPEREMIYSINDKKKALATYKRYVKKYCENM